MTNTTLTTATYLVLSPIMHNHTRYDVGSHIELNEDDAQFLELAKVARKLTDDELAALTANEATTPPLATPPATQQIAQPQSAATPDPALPVHNYSSMTKAELNAELDKRGIKHDAKAANAELMALLEKSDNAKTKAEA